MNQDERERKREFRNMAFIKLGGEKSKSLGYR